MPSTPPLFLCFSQTVSYGAAGSIEDGQGDLSTAEVGPSALVEEQETTKMLAETTPNSPVRAYLQLPCDMQCGCVWSTRYQALSLR